MKVGDKVIVVSNTSGHKFDIGEKVAVDEIRKDGCHQFINERGDWWFLNREDYAYLDDAPAMTQFADECERALAALLKIKEIINEL